MKRFENIHDWKLTLASLFAVMFALAPIFSMKIALVWGVPFAIGTVAMMVAEGVLDVVHEVYGEPVAKQVVVSAAICRAVAWVVALIGTSLPAFHGTSFPSETAWLLGSGIAAMTTGAFFDVYVFAWAKRRWGSRPFWTRMNYSDLIGDAIGLGVFVNLAFVGTDKPKLAIFASGMAVRIVTAFFRTLLFSRLVRHLSVAR